MDGMDISTFEEIDQGMFDMFPGDSDEDEDLPLPDRIGLDSALQDDEKSRLETLSKLKSNNKSKQERELELRLLPPDSIRRQILERSIRGDLHQTLDNGNQDNDLHLGSRQEILDNQISVDDRGVTMGCLLSKSSNDAGKTQLNVMNISEKAGMSGIDKDRINKIIQDASKGSKFYQKQAQRQAGIHKSIEEMLVRVKTATPEALERARVVCDKMIEDLKKQRVFNKIIVHIDLDMFFAAVEIRDDPTLAEKPVAVGGDAMIATSNYVARRFGVRAAMPGFIAKKLCPNLIMIPTHGAKYRQASSEVFSILEHYDEDFTNTSLDEAYLDITEYVKDGLERDGLDCQEYYDGTLPKVYWTRANQVVSEIRQAVFDKTRLTCSAGVSCNTLIAKISTDINKPDGQFMVEGYPTDIHDFITKTPVEKVSGIGKVTAQFLNALDIKTCGDIFHKRHFLPIVFFEINIRFYLRVAIGDGATEVKSDDTRKSKSVERTFSTVKDSLILLDKLDSICEELCSKYLKPYKIMGRTVTVKIKRNTFATTTKSYSLLVPTNDKMVIYPTAKNLLMSVISHEPPEISYRLLGVKLSNLADDGIMSNQLTIDAMFRNQELANTTKSDKIVHQIEDEPHQEPLLVPVASTSQSSSRGDSSSEKVETPRRRSPSGLNSRSRSRKRTNSSDQPSIETFFSKMPRLSSPELSTPSPDSHRLDHMQDPEDGDMFFDAEDKYQCPYCFKSIADFFELESHCKNCRFRTSVDVNRSLIAHRSQPVTPSTSQNAKTKQNARTKRAKVQTQNGLLKSLNNSVGQPSTSKGVTGNSKINGQAAKPSFYQQFMESNSHRLSQAQKREPMRCPHCYHGFLDFPTLQTHSMNCTKRKPR